MTSFHSILLVMFFGKLTVNLIIQFCLRTFKFPLSVLHFYYDMTNSDLKKIIMFGMHWPSQICVLVIFNFSGKFFAINLTKCFCSILPVLM
jgi:hypothetical protein